MYGTMTHTNDIQNCIIIFAFYVQTLFDLTFNFASAHLMKPSVRYGSCCSRLLSTYIYDVRVCTVRNGNKYYYYYIFFLEHRQHMKYLLHSMYLHTTFFRRTVKCTVDSLCTSFTYESQQFIRRYDFTSERFIIIYDKKKKVR